MTNALEAELAMEGSNQDIIVNHAFIQLANLTAEEPLKVQVIPCPRSVDLQVWRPSLRLRWSTPRRRRLQRYRRPLSQKYPFLMRWSARLNLTSQWMILMSSRVSV